MSAELKRFDDIDLSKLAPPDVVQTLDYEVILAEMLADLNRRHPEFSALVESDPAYKILEVVAYRELLIRQRVNEAAQANMLATAKGADLENLGAFYGVARQIIIPANPDATPPIKAVMEDDDRYRHRIQLSLEAHTTAGPVDSYRYHALSAHPHIKDVAILRPQAGTVKVVVLSDDPKGVTSDAILQAVRDRLNDEKIRPLCDTVEVIRATINKWRFECSIEFEHGPDGDTVKQSIIEKIKDYLKTKAFFIGKKVMVGEIYAILHQPGVSLVRITHQVPRFYLERITIPVDEAHYCSTVVINDEVIALV